MKLSPKQWCHIQETLANMKCPRCFSAEVKLEDCEKDNAKCIKCGCKFEFDPEIITWAE